VNDGVGRTVGGGGSSGFGVEMYDGKEMRFRGPHAMLLCSVKVVVEEVQVPRSSTIRRRVACLRMVALVMCDDTNNNARVNKRVFRRLDVPEDC
jgi:hypothetical protein